MKNKIRLIVLLFALALVSFNSGCAFYVGNELSGREYGILRPVEKQPLVVHVEYQTNGKAAGDIYKQQWTKCFVEAFNQSNLFSTVESAEGQTNKTAQRIDITVDEQFDEGETFLKGFITGFTFFIVGCDVSAIDKFTAVYTPADFGPSKRFEYSQSYHFTMGLIVARPPGDKQPSIEAGTKQIIKNFTVQLLDDLQKSGAL